MFATVIGLLGLLVKLAGLQAISPDRFAERAKEQRLAVEALPAVRGAIVDRNGEPLVTTEKRKTIYTDPANVEPGKAPEIAAALSPLLGVPAGELQAGLEADSNFSYLARKVDEPTADAVMALGYSGIYTLDERTRLKPADDLALSVIGSVDTENMGISGVERAYDTMLSGTPGESLQDRSLGGDHTIPSGRQAVRPAVPGSTVMLTIDRNLQQVAERAVADQIVALRAAAGIAVVMDRRSGEIVAMASVARDAKTDKTYNDAQNRAITTTYDPGSTMKIVTMSGAIENGLVNAATVRHVPAKVDFYEDSFSDDSRYADEDMTLTDILARSSNVGTIGVAQELGERRLAENIESFGFGAATGVGLDQEETGIVPPLEEWSGTSLPTLAIGQGLTATPLQVLAAYNTIANDGEYVSPTVVRSVLSPAREEATRVVADHRTVVSPQTAEQVRTMLGAVVSRGTGVRAQVAGYDVAGKTGTAWKFRAGGGYGSTGDRDYVATFVGFAPAKDPKFSIIVVIDEPRSGVYTGGLAAAPVFSVIARQALLRYDIAPSAPGWTQPSNGTNLRARAAEAAPLPDPVMVLAPPSTAAPAVPTPGPAAGGSAATTAAEPSSAKPTAAVVGQRAPATSPPART